MWKKILVGVDGSDPSLHALEVAAGMAANNEAELTILSVVPPLPPIMEGDMPPYAPEFTTDLTESYENMVNAKAEEVREKHKGLNAVPIVMLGSPSRMIIEASRARESDLIVVGNRGTSGILSWMLGSVSRQVTDSCTVPVLVIKDQKYCET